MIRTSNSSGFTFAFLLVFGFSAYFVAGFGDEEEDTALIEWYRNNVAYWKVQCPVCTDSDSSGCSKPITFPECDNCVVCIEHKGYSLPTPSPTTALQGYAANLIDSYRSEHSYAEYKAECPVCIPDVCPDPVEWPDCRSCYLCVKSIDTPSPTPVPTTTASDEEKTALIESYRETYSVAFIKSQCYNCFYGVCPEIIEYPACNNCYGCIVHVGFEYEATESPTPYPTTTASAEEKTELIEGYRSTVSYQVMKAQCSNCIYDICPVDIEYPACNNCYGCIVHIGFVYKTTESPTPYPTTTASAEEKTALIESYRETYSYAVIKSQCYNCIYDICPESIEYPACNNCYGCIVHVGFSSLVVTNPFGFDAVYTWNQSTLQFIAAIFVMLSLCAVAGWTAYWTQKRNQNQVPLVKFQKVAAADYDSEDIMLKE